MDLKDKKIVHYLDSYGRATYVQIAKATRIPLETVRYRILALQNQGIIRKFLPIVNTVLLGYSFYQLMIKLENVNETKKTSIVEFLTHAGSVHWVGLLDGVYDIAFILSVQHQIELREFVDSFFLKFSNTVMKRTLSINIEGSFFPRDYLVGKKRSIRGFSKYAPATNLQKIDELDSELCRLLSDNGRETAVSLAAKLGCSADTVLLRMRGLAKKGVISGYMVILCNTSILHYKLLFYLNNITPESEKQFTTFVSLHSNVIALIKSLGEWNYEIDVEVESVPELQQFTMAITSKFSSIIRDYITLRITSMPKYSFY